MLLPRGFSPPSEHKLRNCQLHKVETEWRSPGLLEWRQLKRIVSTFKVDLMNFPRWKQFPKTMQKSLTELRRSIIICYRWITGVEVHLASTLLVGSFCILSRLDVFFFCTRYTHPQLVLPVHPSFLLGHLDTFRSSKSFPNLEQRTWSIRAWTSRSKLLHMIQKWCVSLLNLLCEKAIYPEVHLSDLELLWWTLVLLGENVHESSAVTSDLSCLILVASRLQIFLCLTGELSKNLIQCQSFDHVRAVFFEKSRCFLSMIMLHRVCVFLQALSPSCLFSLEHEKWTNFSFEFASVLALSLSAINVTLFATRSAELSDVSLFWFSVRTTVPFAVIWRQFWTSSVRAFTQINTSRLLFRRKYFFLRSVQFCFGVQLFERSIHLWNLLVCHLFHFQGRSLSSFQDESNFWKQCRSLWRPSSSSWMHHWRRSACSHHIVSRRNESVQDTCPDFVAEFHLIFLWGCVDTYPSSMKNPNLKCSKKSEFDSATCKSCTEPSIGPKSEIVYECPSSAWPCRIHSSTLSAVSFVLQPRKSQIWMEFAVQHYSLQIPCNVRDNNCIFWWTCLLIVLSHSRNRIWKQSCIFDNSQSKRPLVSQIRWFLTIWDEVSTCNRFPSALKAKSTPARRYLWSCVQLNSWLLKCSKVKLLSRTQPGFNIFDAYGLQISSTLSVCAITWSHCLELCKSWARERRARKSCGHHLLHRVVWFATRSTKNTIASGLTYPFCLKMSATWSVVRTC